VGDCELVWIGDAWCVGLWLGVLVWCVCVIGVGSCGFGGVGDVLLWGVGWCVNGGWWGKLVGCG